MTCSIGLNFNMTFTRTQTQLLFPVSVPWMISPSTARLRIENSSDGTMAAYFAAYFRCEEKTKLETTPPPSMVKDQVNFVPDETSTGAPYRLVRVQFEGLHASRQMPAASETEVLSRDDFDWSLVPSNMLVGEAMGEYRLRMARM